ncbi:His/Gly/Thr/Pro-type tRNA ligase C-terminal domain-containing protein, partial [Pontiella sp.]|uniref:His/Gly/Thr/Pro-type tRNA ligase C-terminal domain-containing protein n=1 Tax=Pontiella sp. TaxID=2837462 RepID=UPI00356240C1
IEAMMQDRKALQAGTSHFLGQNFAKASGIQYAAREGDKEFAWTTSWGVSTRLIGGMIMTHGDDDGMVMPPRLAPSHVVLLPIIRQEEDREAILAYCNEIAAKLRTQRFHEREVEVVIDARDINAGEKGWGWVKKGIPVRAEVGPRDMANHSVFMARRDTGEKKGIDKDEFVATIAQTLEDIQQGMLQKARDYRAAYTREIDSYDEFVAFFTPENKERPEAHGGFAMSHWCDGSACEDKISDDLSVTIRTVPFDRAESGAGQCVCCGKPSSGRVVFAKSY